MKKDFKGLKELCQCSKNLYNQLLYTLNEEFKASREYWGYNSLDKSMQKKTNLEGKINYKLRLKKFYNKKDLIWNTKFKNKKRL
jgi:hypothetical protein